MKRKIRILMALAALAAAVVRPAGAAPAGRLPAAPFDARNSAAPVTPTHAQIAAITALHREGAGLRFEWNARFGTPSTILRYGAALTSPAPDPVEASRGWLTSHASLFGWTASDVARLSVEKVLTQPNHGPKAVLLHQTFGGLHGGSFGGSVLVATDDRNRMLSVRANVVRAPSIASGPRISAAAAVMRAGGLATAAPSLGEANGWLRFGRAGAGLTHYARLAAFPIPGAAARPAYEVFFAQAETSMFRTVVDAIDGSILFRRQTVENFAPEGRVFKNYPGAPDGGTHEMVSFRGDKEASPAGWLSPQSSAYRLPTTIGNNAYTATHWVAGQAPDGPGELRPISADSTFDEPFSDAWRTQQCGEVQDTGQNVVPAYAVDAMPAVVNLFYHHNVMHDYWYALGFTPEAGALQANNFGRAGLGGDPLLGLAQTGGLVFRNNAYMNPLPDGVPSYTGMFLWEPSTPGGLPPCVDGDFDAAVIYHEYTHAVSNRWVGGEYGNLNGAQGGAMGEAWGDYTALNYLQEHGYETGTALGPYVTGDAVRGIRNWAMDEVAARYGDYGYDGGPEVHSDGEIWNGVLWDLRTTLGKARANGERYATQLIADAMPISGPSPSMLNMRDAILEADVARTGGAYQTELWQVFARRGMGFSASTAGAADTSPRQAFDAREPGENGRVVVRVVDPESGKPIWGAEVLGGTVEASTPLATTDQNGRASVWMAAVAHSITIRAPGYGSRSFVMTVPAGRRVERTIEFSPNYASRALGASVAAADATIEAGALIDDNRFTAVAIPANKDRYVTIKLAGTAPVDVREVRVAAGPGGSALDKFKIEASSDGGKTFASLTGGRLGRLARPFAVGIADTDYRSFRPATVVRATHIRLVALSSQISGDSINVAEVQVFGSGDRYAIKPGKVKQLKDEGMMTVALPLTPDVAAASPTMAYMSQNCSFPPPTQGVDAWVTQVPPEFQGARMRAEAPDLGNQGALPEFDVYFLDSSCAQIGFIASPDPMPHETGPIPSGTKYIVVLFFLGPPSSVTVTAETAARTVVHLGAPSPARRR